MSFTDRAERYLFNNRYFLLYCLGISFLVFGFEIFNVAISIDEETPSLISGPMLYWISIDRWGLYMINALLQWGPPMPFFHILIAIFANLLAYLAFLRLLRPRNMLAKYIGAIFFLTYPMISFVYEYNQLQYANYIGLFCAISAVVYFVEAKSMGRRMLVATCLMIFVLSIYQTILFASLVVFFLHLLKDLLHSKKSDSRPTDVLKKVFLFGLCVVVSVLVHEIVSGYIRNALNLGRYHTIEHVYGFSFLKSYDVIFVLREIGALLLGQRWYVGWATGVVFLMSVFVLLNFIFHAALRSKLKVMATLFLGLAILSPFILIIVTAHPWAARTFVALPVLMGGITIIAVDQANKTLRRVLIMLSTLCFVWYWSTTTRMFYSNYSIWNRDKLLLNRLVHRIESDFGDRLGDGPVPLHIHGVPQRPKNDLYTVTETMGASILEWDGGNASRINAVFKIIGVEYFKIPSTSQLSMAVDQAETMPLWPARESVQWKEGVIIVKFSDKEEMR